MRLTEAMNKWRVRKIGKRYVVQGLDGFTNGRPSWRTRSLKYWTREAALVEMAIVATSRRGRPRA